MSKVWVVAAVAAAAVGGAVGYAMVKARMPDLGPAGPNRDLAPESLACYAEVGDGAGLWTKMRGTEAWNDLAASKLAAVVADAGPVKDFLAALEQVATKANYRIDPANAMKLVGRELSVGVKLDPAGGVPQVLVLTKLDTAALAKDLLNGGTDLDALWAELQKRTGSLDFKITASEHRGQKMATAARGDASYHATLLGDTLAVATDAALLRAAIDCRLDGGAKSLGHRTEFQADMKALPAGGSLLEWYDLDALDAGRKSLDAGLARFSDKPYVAGAVHAILDGTKGAHTLGRAVMLPDGDLYRFSWSYSKSAELFADRASPAITGVLDGDWAIYAEFRQIGGVADAWKNSSLRKNLAAGEIGKWLDNAMNDPAKTMSGAADLFKHGPFGTPFIKELEDDEQKAIAKPMSIADALGDRFTVQMGKHLLEHWIAAMTKGEGALAADYAKKIDIENLRLAGAVRLDTEGRLLALAAQGALLSLDKKEFKSETCGTRTVWTVGDEKALHWSLVGDTFVATTDLELVRRAAQSDGSAPAPKGRIAESMAALKPGWRAYVAYDLERFIGDLSSAMAGSRRRNSGMPQFDKIFEVYREAGVYGNSGDLAVYVPDDFASVEMRARVHLAPPTTDDGRALRAEWADAREPRCWASLPDTTIMHGTAPASGVRMLWVVAKGVASMVGGDMNSIASSFREAMGMDLEKDLIPALGRELFIAITYAAPPAGAPAPDGPPKVLPGLLIGLEVKDQAVVKKAVDRAIELAEESIHESQGAGGESPFTRVAHEGVEIIRLNVPREQMPVPISPACALHDGFLWITLDDATLQTCIDVHKGKAPRLADSRAFASATGDLGKKTAGFWLVDWDRLADQVAVYAPMLSQFVASDDIAYPDFPDDGNQDAWQKKVEEYQKKMAESRGAGEAKVRKWIDAFRVIEYLGSSGTLKGDTTETTFVVRFKK